MNQYETIVVINPNVESESVEKIIGDIEELMSGDGGKVTKLENWGKRRLAYEVKGNKDGIYVLLNFEAEPKLIQRLERYFILNEQIIKYMTVRAENLPEPRRREVSRRKFDEEDEFLQKDFNRYIDRDEMDDEGYGDYDYDEDEDNV